MTTDFDKQSSNRTGFRVDLTGWDLTEAEIQRLRNDMHLFRLGAALPSRYIALHGKVAEHYAPSFAREQKVRIVAKEYVADGWLDGMTVLRLICEDAKGNLRDYRWSDANGGSWFKRLESGGQILIHRVGVPGYL